MMYQQGLISGNTIVRTINGTPISGGIAAADFNSGGNSTGMNTGYTGHSGQHTGFEENGMSQEDMALLGMDDGYHDARAVKTVRGLKRQK